MSNSFDKAMLEKATTSTDEPTPAWMFHQMAKWTRDYSSCQKMEDFLFKKLNSGKPHSIKKALIVIKQVASQGDTQFAVNLAKKTEEIKKFSSYKGPIDPQYGDALNNMIRQAASEAIQAIFQRTESRAQPQQQFEQDPRVGSGNLGVMQKDPEANQYNNMQGIGSGGLGPSQYSGSGIGSGGFGSPANSYIPNSGSIGGMGNMGSPSGMGSMGGSRMQGIGSPAAMANMASQGAANDGYIAKAVNAVSGLLQRDKYPSGFKPDQHMNFISEDISSTYQPPNEGANLQAKPMGGFFSQEDSSSRDDFDVKAQTAASNAGIHEQKIVDEFCLVSAVQAIPSRAEISQFCNRCASVNSELIALKLYEKLSPVNNWQVKLKALVAVEALIKAKNVAVFAFFTSNFDNVQALTVAQQDKLAQRATKVLNLLQNKPDVDAPKQRKVPQQLPQGSFMKGAPLKKDDLLDLGAEDQAGDDNMFEGMPVTPQQHSAPPQAVNHHNNPFQPSNSGHGDDFLADLMSGPSVNNNNVQNQKERARANSSSILEFFPSAQPAPVMANGRGANVVTVPVYIPVAVPVQQMGMQPVAMQPLRPAQLAPMKPSTPVQQSGTPSGFDFMKNQPTVDSFEFVRDEMLKKK